MRAKPAKKRFVSHPSEDACGRRADVSAPRDDGAESVPDPRPVSARSKKTAAASNAARARSVNGRMITHLLLHLHHLQRAGHRQTWSNTRCRYRAVGKRPAESQRGRAAARRSRRAGSEHGSRPVNATPTKSEKPEKLVALAAPRPAGPPKARALSTAPTATALGDCAAEPRIHRAAAGPELGGTVGDGTPECQDEATGGIRRRAAIRVVGPGGRHRVSRTRRRGVLAEGHDGCGRAEGAKLEIGLSEKTSGAYRACGRGERAQATDLRRTPSDRDRHAHESRDAGPSGTTRGSILQLVAVH